MASSIQLLRSTNPQERPFAGNLLEGQPAANLHSSEPGLFFKTTDGSIVKFGPAAITSDGSPPNSTPQGSAGNSVGELWLDKSVDPAVLKVYDGAQWVDAGSGGGGGGGVSFLRWIYVASGGETSLSGSSGGVLLEYTAGLEEVFINGVLITRGTDYSAINGTSITNLSPLAVGDVVTVLSMNPLEIVQLPGQVTLLRWTILATAGQTVLSGVDSSSQQLAYTAGFEEVYVNGVFLRRGIDYIAIDGSSITVSAPLTEDDEITVMAWTPFVIGSQITDGDVAPDAEISSSKLAFTQFGSPITRSIREKFGEAISVTDFGADPTGATDSTASIQAAIDYASSSSSGSNAVYIPRGLYLIDPAVGINVTQGLTLFGAGRSNTQLVAKPVGGTIIKRAFNPLGPNAYVDGVTIRDIGIILRHPTVADPNNYFQVAIQFRHITRSLIEDVYIGNYPGGISSSLPSPPSQADARQGYGVSIGSTSGSDPAYAGGEVNTCRRVMCAGVRYGFTIDNPTFDTPFGGSAAYTTVIDCCEVSAAEVGISQYGQYGAGCTFSNNVIQAIDQMRGSTATSYSVYIDGYEHLIYGGYNESPFTDYELFLSSSSRRNRVLPWLSDDGAFADFGIGNVYERIDSSTNEWELSVNNRNYSQKLRDYVSVKDFGAVGDGQNDDTQAIQAAISKANEYVNSGISTGIGRGIRVVFPKGLYKITSTISLSSASYLSLEGDGPLTSNLITYIDGDLIRGTSVNDISLRNLGIINLGNPTSGFAINVGGDPVLNSVPAAARYLRFDNLQISGFANGVKINGALSTTLRDCRIGGKGLANTYGLYLGDAVVTTHSGDGVTQTYNLQYDNSNFPVLAFVEGIGVPITKSATTVTFSSPPALGAKIRLLERLVQGTTVSGDNVYISQFHTGLKNFVEGADFSNLIIEFCTDYAIHAEASLSANLYLEANSKAVRAFRPVKLSTNQENTALWGVSTYENALSRGNSIVSQPSRRLISSYKLETSQLLTGSLASPGKLTFTPVEGSQDVNPLYMDCGGYGLSWADISGVVHFAEPLAAGKTIRLRVEYSSYSSPGVYNLYWFEYFDIGGPTNPGIDSPFISFSSCRIVSQGTRVSISAYSDQATQSAYGSTVSGRNSYVKIATV